MPSACGEKRWPAGICRTQLDVLASVIAGLAAKDAAPAMGVSLETYKGYRRTLLRRAGLSSAAEVQARVIAHLAGVRGTALPADVALSIADAVAPHILRDRLERMPLRVDGAQMLRARK